MNGARLPRAHRALGFAALAALLAGGALSAPGGSLRLPARVEAGQTFSLIAADEAFTWTLRDGAAPRGGGIVTREGLRFERGELGSLRLSEGRETGARVAAGAPLARRGSGRAARRVAELEATREALAHQAALLQAGGRPADVEQARRQLVLAQARRAEGSAEVERLSKLATAGALGAAELETARLRDQVLARGVEVAMAGLSVARAPAHPEAISAVEAQIAAVDARLDEARALLSEDLLASPVDGLLELGGRTLAGQDVVLQVYGLGEVYAHLPLPEAAAGRVVAGDPVVFSTNAAPGAVLAGEVVEIAPAATPTPEGQVFWASARIEDPEGRLRPGAIGVARVEPSGDGGGAMAWLRREISQ